MSRLNLPYAQILNVHIIYVIPSEMYYWSAPCNYCSLSSTAVRNSEIYLAQNTPKGDLIYASLVSWVATEKLSKFFLKIRLALFVYHYCFSLTNAFFIQRISRYSFWRIKFKKDSKMVCQCQVAIFQI